MDLSKDITSEIDQLIDTFECSKDCSCYQLKFEELCEAVIFGDGEMIECVDEQASDCQFSSPFGDGYFCSFPLRAYVAKKFKK